MQSRNALSPSLYPWELDFLASEEAQPLLVKRDGNMHFAPLMPCSAQISLNKYLQGSSKKL